MKIRNKFFNGYIDLETDDNKLIMGMNPDLKASPELDNYLDEDEIPILFI